MLDALLDLRSQMRISLAAVTERLQNGMVCIIIFKICDAHAAVSLLS